MYLANYRHETKIVETPVRKPGVSTGTETEKEEEKKKEEDPKPPLPGDPRRVPTTQDESSQTDPNTKRNDKLKSTRVGYLRPFLPVGGQDILLISEKERLQEIEDWDMFNLVIPESQDLSNPISNLNNMQNFARFHGVDGRWRPRQFYQPAPRRFVVNKSVVVQMQPVMRGQHSRMPMSNPYDRQAYDNLDLAYRQSLNEIRDIKQRAGNIYPDVLTQVNNPTPRSVSVLLPNVDIYDS